GGAASPRNHGIRLAEGKYIAFCDDDDLWMSDKIEKQVCVLEERSEYSLCYTKMLRFDEVNEWTNFHDARPANFESLLYKNTIPISSVLIKRSILQQFGYFSESKMVCASEDYELFLRLSIANKFYFLDECLIKYWSGNNRTTSLNNKNILVVFLYTLRIFKCYYLVYSHKKTKIACFLKPAIFHVINLCKAVGYILLSRIGLK
ncbi:MAG TPA: glycosyltransferase, partial [Gammaproteobacteria bacterium]|nr:glycosyltransferase [Gammaproteobacteria bacterium]